LLAGGIARSIWSVIDSAAVVGNSYGLFFLQNIGLVFGADTAFQLHADSKIDSISGWLSPSP